MIYTQDAYLNGQEGQSSELFAKVAGGVTDLIGSFSPDCMIGCVGSGDWNSCMNDCQAAKAGKTTVVQDDKMDLTPWLIGGGLLVAGLITFLIVRK